MNNINWLDPDSKVTTNFTVHDCLFLPSWGRLANESDGLNDEIKENLINLCAKMEVVRNFLGNIPIITHVCYRPEAYNTLIGGAPNSYHCKGLAIDFNIENYIGNDGCDKVRELLKPQLENLDLRMEDISNKTNRNWIHLDLGKPGINSDGTTRRYFKP